VKATLATARKRGAARPLHVSAAPLLAHREAEGGIWQGISHADVAIMADVYAASEIPPGVSGQTSSMRWCARAMTRPASSPTARRCPEIGGALEPGDVVLRLGAGNIMRRPLLREGIKQLDELQT